MPNAALVAKGLDSRESDELRALGYLQRLNLAGYDVKGQISSAYGQSGVGLSVGVNFDFGALLVPLVHIDVGAELEGERTAHSVLVLQRMPDRVWLEDMVRPPQSPKKNPEAPPPPFPNPSWTAPHPLALAFLHGKTWRLKAKAAADAWAGLGSLDYDETGLAVGFEAHGGVEGMLTRLVDTAPRHYPATPSDSRLNDDVDDLFDASLKNKAAAWLVETGGGVQEILELGAPRTPLTERMTLAAIGEKIEPAILTALGAYDKLAIPDVDSAAIAETGFSVIRILANAAKKIKRVVGSKKLVTDDLLAEFGAVETELRSWIRYLANDRESGGVYSSKTRTYLSEIAKRRLAEAEDFHAALERRKQRKQRRSIPMKAPAPVDRSPPFHLDITSIEGSGDVKAIAKLALPFREDATLKGAAGRELRSRRISFRYQSFVPGGATGRTLLCSQQTVINYVSRRVVRDWKVGKREKERPNLVTMSYRSVLANWFDDLAPNNQKAIPNGSGVSFGMSVLAQSFGGYARACKMMKKPPPGQLKLAALPEEYKALEAALTKHLRVTTDELRRFMRNAPSGMGDVTLKSEKDLRGEEARGLEPDADARAESFLIESGFALISSLPLDIEDHRPKALFDLAPVKDLVGKSDRGNALRLQVIRLRFRVRSDDDKSRNLIRLGWNPEPWGEEDIAPWGVNTADASKPWYVRLTGVDPELPNWLKHSALALELGIGIERVRRVGSEGVVELYHRLYPDPYSHADPPEGYGRDRAKQLEERNHRAITDMLVPPVALFSQ